MTAKNPTRKTKAGSIGAHKSVHALDNSNLRNFQKFLKESMCLSKAASIFITEYVRNEVLPGFRVTE